MRKPLLVAALIALLASPAWADTEGSVAPGTAATRSGLAGCIYNPGGVTASGGQQMAQQCDSSGALMVSASVSASISGFAPNGNYANLSVSDSTGNVALPVGAVVVVYNVGANPAFVNLGTSAAVAATVDEIAVPAGGWLQLTVGSNTYIAGIAGTGLSTTLNVAGGAGIAAGSGGGSGGGGGDVNITEVGGSAIALGQTTMSASLPVVIASNQSAVPASQSGTWNITNISGTVSLPTGASTSANQTTEITALGTINTTLGTPMQDSGGSVTANLGTLGGAATEAKQPALGTAGSASSDVITIQGVASMTPLDVSAASLPLPTGAATDANQSTEITALGTINTTLGSPMQSSGGSLTANIGTTGGLALDASLTDVESAPGTPQTLGFTIQGNASGVPVPVTGTVTAANPSVGTNGATAPSSSTQGGWLDGSGNLQPVSASNPLPVAGTFSATISGFAPNSNTTGPLAVTGTTGNVALPSGTVVAIINTGSVTAYVNLGVDNTVTATTSDMPILPFGGCVLLVGSNTYAAAITASSTTSLSLEGGAGLGTACWAGAAGSSGGTSSTFTATFPGTGTAAGFSDGTNMVPGLVDGSGNLKVDVAAGTVAATQSGTWNVTDISGTISLPTGASTSANQSTEITALGTINTTLGSPMQTSGGSVTANLGTIGGAATATNQAAVQGPIAPATATATKSVVIGGQYNSAGVTFTDGQQGSMQLDAAGLLETNCVSGCAGGTFNNNSDGVATSATNGQAAAWLYGFNGTTWDRLTVDGSKNLDVNVAAGTVAATQSGTWNITNVSGTISLPTGASTSALQSGVQGTVAAGSAPTNMVVGGLVYNSSAPTPSTGQSVSLQGDSSANLLVDLKTALPVGANTIGAVTEAGTWNVGLSAGANVVGAVTQSGTWNVGLSSGSNVIGATGYAQASSTSGEYGPLSQCAVTTAAPSYTTAQTDPLSCDTAGGLRVNTGTVATNADAAVTAGSAPSKVLVTGLVYNSSPPSPSNGQSMAMQADSSGNLKVNVANSPTVTANAGTNLNTSALALETGGNLATLAGAVTSSVVQVNTKQVNGVTTLAGTGAVGTGAQRVAVGTDTATIAGSAPGTAQAPSSNVVTTAHPTSNMVTGTANTTGTSTTSLVTAVSSNRIYVTAFGCANTGSTASLISFQDGSGGTTLWTTIVPAGGGSNLGSALPLFKTTSGNALYFAAASASTTIYCSASGFSGG